MSADFVDAGRERRFRAAAVAGAAAAAAFAGALLVGIVAYAHASTDAEWDALDPSHTVARLYPFALVLAVPILVLAVVPGLTLVAIVRKQAPGPWMRAAGVAAALGLIGLTVAWLASAPQSCEIPSAWPPLVCLAASGVVAFGELGRALRSPVGDGGWERWGHAVASTAAAGVAFTVIMAADPTNGPVLRSDATTQLLLVAGGALAPATLWIVLAGRESRRALGAALAMLGLAALSSDPIGAVMARRRVRASGSDTLPINLVTLDQIRTERALAGRGDPVGATLISPRIDIDARGVTVNGRSVTSLGETLGGLHDHWKAIYGWKLYSAARLDARPVIVVAEDAEVPAVTRAFADLSSGPYHFQTGGLEWNAGLVATPSWSLCVGPSKTRVVLGRDAAGPRLAVSTSCPRDPSGSTPERSWSEPRDAGGPGELHAALVRACDGRVECLLWVGPSPGKFGDIAGVMASAFAADGPRNLALDVAAR